MTNNSKFKYLIKNTGILAISNFSSKVLNFLLVPVYTAVLSTEEYGFYDAIVTTIGLLYPILTLNIVEGVMRFLMNREKDKTGVISIGNKYVFSSIFLYALILIVNFIFNLIPSIIPYSLWIFLYATFTTLNEYCVAIAKGFEEVKAMGIAGILGTIVSVSLNLLLLLVIKMGLTGFFLANTMGQLIPVLYFFVIIKPWNYFSLSIDKALEREILKYSIPLIATAVMWWVNGAADRYVVLFFVGVSANGLLSVAYKIPTILNTIQQIFIQAWQISAIKNYDDNEAKIFYRSTFSYLNLLMCMACSGLILLTKPLARFLFSKDFYSAWKYVPFLLISSLMVTMAGFIGAILAAKNDSIAVFKSAVTGAISNIVLNIVFVSLIGVQGVTVATAISSTVIYVTRDMAIGDLVHGSKDFKKIVLSWITIVCQAVLMIYTDWVFLCILLTIILLLIYLKQVRTVLARVKEYVVNRKKH